MRYYTQSHQYYCGVDLHTRTMFLCILDAQGQRLFHRNLPTAPEAFLKAIAPYRNDLVIGCECVFTWYWLADLCQKEKLRFVLGHALYMRAIHCGKKKNDKLDASKIAGLLRANLFPQAYAYPTQMRATRDLLRRRCSLVQQRTKLFQHIQISNHQYNLPAFDAPLSRASSRENDTIVSRFEHPSTQLSIRADLELIDVLDEQIRKMEDHLVKHAKVHQQKAYELLQSIPGVGKVLGLVILYEVETIERFGHVGEFLSYARLVRPCQESAGKITGQGNAKIGNAHLRWAIGEAALYLLRDRELAKKWRQRVEAKKGTSIMLSILAARLGRAIYQMLRRGEEFNERKFFGLPAIKEATMPAS